MKIEKICEIFGIKGEMVECTAIKTGNINKTYKVTFEENGKRADYIVQDINKFVFKNPDHIMKNIDAVTSHLAKKFGDEREKYVLDFLKTSDGANYFIDDEDRFMRAYKFIPDSVTYDVFDDLEILQYAGMAFGRFQMQLADFDASTLYEIIPDFHNTASRYENLKKTAEKDEYGLKSEVSEELAFLFDNEELATSLVTKLNEGAIPLRVTHNDTKCNNVLFDVNTGMPLAVIDLDTVMPGLTAYDFGDAVRFAANKAAEDEADTSIVGVDLDKYAAFAKGFVSEVSGALTKAEIETLYLGPIVMALELSSRFLADYLDGSKYFKCNYEKHNLIRARCQIALAKDMIAKMPETKAIIEEYAK